MPNPPVAPRRLSWVVAGLALVVHLGVNRRVGGPVVFADELGYVAAARYFAPDYPDVQMLSAFYHFGYGLLLAPLAMVFDEPAGFYRAATLFNSLMAVAATVVFHQGVLLGRLALPAVPAAGAAAVFALAPSLLVNTSILWAETALVLLLVLLVWTVLGLFRSGSWLWAIASGALAAFAYGTHPRAIVFVIAVAAMVVLAAVTRHLGWDGALAGVGTLVGGVIVVRVVNGRLADALYTEGSILQPAGGLAELVADHPTGYLAGLGGTAWYQLMATAGLAGLGILWLAGRLPMSPGSSPVRRGQWDPMQVLSVFVLMALFGSWLVGATISVSNDIRIDQLYYGRYLDVFAPLLAGLGVVWLTEATARRRMVAAVPVAVLVLVGGWLISLRGSGEFFTTGRVVQVNVPVANGFEAWVGTWNPTGLALVGAALVAAALLAAGPRWWLGAVVAGVGFVAVAETTVSQTIRPASLGSAGRAMLTESVERLGQIESGGNGVVYLAAPYEFWSLNNLQFWADDVQFQLETHCPTSAFDVVIAPTDDARFGDWSVMAADAQFGRQALIDPQINSTTSRAAAVEVAGIEVVGSQVLVAVRVENLDASRPLELGNRLALHARWAGVPEPVEAPIESMLLGPGEVTTLSLQLTSPDLAPGPTELSFDLLDLSRPWLGDAGWLSSAPCGQSRFESADVAGG